MKVFMLANPCSPHVIKWAKSLSAQGVELFIFGLGDCEADIYEEHDNINVYSYGYKISRNGVSGKLKYLFALTKLKKLLQQFSPDIVHAHYATSYGLLGALSGFHPLIISVWGSDIYDFPHRSIFHKFILMSNFRIADAILSTSLDMAAQCKKYTSKEIKITPFGVNLEIFKNDDEYRHFEPGDIVVGTVKTLEDIYGIEYLVRAFYKVSEKHPSLPLKLLIVGGGSLETKLKKLVAELNIADKTCFAGKVPYSEIHKYHNMLSISVFVSLRESFGVSVIEAAACEKPVIVSDVGGLPETLIDGKTGYIVPAKDIDATAAAIEKLALDENLRKTMGQSGREFVMERYELNECVNKMLNIYNNFSERKSLC